MEVLTFEAITITLVVIVLLRYGWVVLNWAWFRPKKFEGQLRKQGLKGTPYRFLFGDSTTMFQRWSEGRRKPINFYDDVVPRVVPFHHDLVMKHGKNAFSWIGPIPTVNVIDPTLLQEIMTKNMVYTKPKFSPLQGLLLEGLVIYNGEKWSTHRKTINPAFHLQKLKAYIISRSIKIWNLFHRTSYRQCIICCNAMIEEWESHFVGENKIYEFDVSNDLKILSADVIVRTAFGGNYQEGKMIFELQRELANLTAEILFSTYIPGWRFLPTNRNRRMREISNEINSFVNEIVRKRQKSMIKGEIAEDDLLGMLLKSSQTLLKENGNNTNASLTVKEAVQEYRFFYFAGPEATSLLMIWTMVLLSVHSEWQTKAREEVMQVFGNNLPGYNGLTRLPITTMILYEVLRLYPPACLIPRVIEKDTRLGGMDFPAGTTFVIPILQIHRDIDLWGKDANEFNPQRFSEGVAKATQKRFTYFPFGWGPRLCIGNNFALLETKMAMAMILQRYIFEISPSYVHAPTMLLTLQPQHGTPLILRKL